MRRILGVVLGVVLVVAGVRPALACGEWSMHDVQKDNYINWKINAGGVYHGEKKRGSIYLDVDNPKKGIRVVKNRKVAFDVKDGVLRRYKKKIGKLADDGSLVIKKKTYTFEFTNPHDFHGMTAWTMLVKRGDKTIVESDEATALCAVAEAKRSGVELTDEEQQYEVRLRVAFYLAWRDLGT